MARMTNGGSQLPKLPALPPNKCVGAQDGTKHRERGHCATAGGVRSLARVRSLALLSCPHAAMISRPRGTRMGAESSCMFRISENLLILWGGVVFGPGPFIKRNEVYLCVNVSQKSGQLMSVSFRIVHAVQHDIFKGNAAGIAGARIGTAGCQQFLDGVLYLLEPTRAKVIPNRMERWRDRRPTHPHAFNHRHETRCREGVRRLRALILGVHDSDRLGHSVKISKGSPMPIITTLRAAARPPRLATQRKCRAPPSFVRQSLRRSNFDHALGTGVAKRASECAANLTEMQAPPIFLRDINRLHLITVPGPQKPFAGTIRRELFGDCGRALDDEGRRQFLLKRSG